MPENPEIAILFVCLGNICRSPLAEGVFRAAAAERLTGRRLTIDSAGTGDWHAGSPPDRRSVAIALRHGIDITGQRARKVLPEDFERFDLVLGMDAANVAALRAMAPAAARERVHLLDTFATGRARDVPDPYYGGGDGFETVYRMLREAAEALAEKLAAPRAMSALASGQASSTM